MTMLAGDEKKVVNVPTGISGAAGRATVILFLAIPPGMPAGHRA